MKYLFYLLTTEDKEQGLVTKALMLSDIKVTLMVNTSNWLRILTENQHQRHIVVVSGTTNFIYDVLHKVGVVVIYCILLHIFLN